jgi:3-hydroxyacyl-CoA dehydrogenase/enoyl-CoA hydratase/3-hydroxybutyryl-CoA epimerase
MKTIALDIQEGIATLTFDEPDSPVNTMCLQWQDDLAQATAAVHAQAKQLRGIILASAKKTFFAGADLKAVMRLRPQDARAVYEQVERTKRQFRTLETLGVPVVSCINGTALGGGWEVALVGHHRIALDDARIQLGLPEVTLGLLPGASGVTKMVRLLGLLAAQPYLMEGQLLNPRQAAELGLVHELVPEPALLRERALAWIAQHPQASHPWDAKGYKIPGGDARSPKIAAALTLAPALLKKKTRGLLHAPQAILACMVEGSLVDVDTALRIESRYLAQLMTAGQAQSMINTFFFNLNEVKSASMRPAGVARQRPQKVGIVGAGMMGAGIAWAQASRGIATVLIDTDQARADRGKAYSQALASQRVAKGRMDAAEQQALLDRIEASERMEDLRGCDLIIEAVFEQRELKAQVTRQVQPLLSDGGILASNTSTLPISGLAQASGDPERFIGIHFFSPVDKMQLVEIIRGRQTSAETVARAIDYVQALGKLPIVVKDSRGFYTSRTFGTFVMEGAALVGEGVPAAVIENAAMQAGMPVGPLAVLDETSLTLAVHVLEQTRADFAAEGAQHHDSAGQLLVERMVKEFKRGGRAAGGGFYDYPSGQPKRLWPELAKRLEKPMSPWSLQDIKDRLLYRQAIETARCLQEGVLGSVHEANIGSIFGIGFPTWTGGALQFIYAQGVAQFARRCDELALAHGAGFKLEPIVIDCLLEHQPKW